MIVTMKRDVGTAGRFFLSAILVISASAAFSADSPPLNPDDFKNQPSAPKSVEEQEAQLLKADAQILEEARQAQLFNPPAFSNADLRTKTYDANLARGKKSALDFKAKAESQLKNPFKASFLYFLEGLTSTFIIYSDPREPDTLVGEQSIVDFEQIASKMFTKYLTLQASLADLNLDPAATDQNSTPSPDPRTDIRLAHSIKLADGKLAPGKNNEEKARAFVSEAFERMVRIFIAGSDQLQRDTGVPWKGPKKILGMYKGFTPDLLNSTKEDLIIPGNFYTEWANCGIANMSNGLFKYFKFPDNQYKDESPGNSHQCQGGGDGQAVARGDMVTVLMSLMTKMQTDLKTKGKVIQASAYSVVDYCASMRAELGANRDLIKEDRDTLYAGLGKQKDVKDSVECAENEKFSGNSSRQGGKVEGVQMRSCMLASLQNEVELNLMTKYMYCTWRSVAGEVIKRFTGALVGENKKETAPSLFAKKNPDPDFFLELRKKLSSFWISKAYASSSTSVAAQNRDSVAQRGTNANVGSSALKGQALSYAAFGTAGGWGYGLAFGGTVGFQQGQRFQRQRANAAKNAQEGFVNCKDGGGVFKTGLLPPIPPYIFIQIPNPPDENTVNSLAELAFQTNDAPSIEAGKALVRGLGNCDRLCYGAKKSADIAAQLKSEKTEEYKQKYLSGLGGCTGKTFKTDIMSAMSQIKSDCSCDVQLPQTPPPVNLNIANNLNNARNLTGKQSGAGIEDGAPPPESNIIETEMPTDLAATAGSAPEVKKQGIGGPIKWEGLSLEKTQSADTAAASEPKPQGYELKKVHTGVLGGPADKYDLDPNNAVYTDVNKAAGKNASPKPSGRRKFIRRGGKIVLSDGSSQPGDEELGDDESLPAMLSEDPDDYWHRAKMDDDIFKMISRRYLGHSKQFDE